MGLGSRLVLVASTKNMAVAVTMLIATMKIMFARSEVSIPVTNGITEHDNNYSVISPVLDLHYYVHLPSLNTPIIVICSIYDALIYNVQRTDMQKVSDRP